METYRYNTLRFFRVQFGLPARMPLEWCVVRETSRAGSELRLGVALKGTGLYQSNCAIINFIQPH